MDNIFGIDTVLNKTANQYRYASTIDGNFKYISYEEMLELPEKCTKFVACYNLDKEQIGFKPHNIKSIDFIPLVITDFNLFFETFGNYLSNYFVTETRNNKEQQLRYQVWIQTRYGVADISTIKHIKEELCKKYTFIFSKFPVTYSFLEIPNDSTCNVIYSKNIGDFQDWNNLLSNLRLAGIEIPYSAKEDAENRYIGFYSKNIMFNNEWEPTMFIAQNYVSTLAYYCNKLKISPEEANKLLKTTDIKSMKELFINNVLPVTALGLHFNDLQYNNIDKQSCYTGKQYIYNPKENKWISQLSNTKHLPITYEKCFGEWRCEKFLTESCRISLPDIFKSKKEQVNSFLEKHNGEDNALISFLRK